MSESSESGSDGSDRDDQVDLLDDRINALLAEVAQLRAERDALAAELNLDGNRHEFEPWSSYDIRICRVCHTEDYYTHRTSRVVLAELAEAQPR